MRISSPWNLVLCCCLATSAFSADVDKEPVLTQHKLPADPSAPVIIYDSQGGQLPRQSQDPVMTIQADGKVILRNPWGVSKEVEGKLSATELQELLRFCLDAQKFFEFDPAKVREEIQKAQAGLGLHIADAGTTLITIHADDQEHTAKYYALGMMARQYPQVKSLSQLDAVQQKLLNIQTDIRIGGKEGKAKVLKLANAELKQKHPKVKPFTEEDLRSAYHSADGTLGVNLSRVTNDENGKVLTSVSANLRIPTEGKPTINIYGKFDK